MVSFRSVCLAGISLVAMATAQDIEPSNATSIDANAVTLTTSLNNDMVPLAPVIPLTTAARQSLPPTGLSGSIFLVNATSTFYLDSRNIAAISCDPQPGQLQGQYLFNQAVGANASAVLFYSPTSETCTLDNYDGDYPWVYSMREQDDTTQLLQKVERSYETELWLWAQIVLTDNLDGNGSVGPGGRDIGSGEGANSGGQHAADENPLGPSPTTAVAMIILYSITGVITALFLVIIITGALRAHRHPERYGPRNIVGRPRQSRAKGIARAMLDTLPIVKFGQRDDEPKPTDVELAENGGEDRQRSSDNINEATTDTSPPQNESTTTQPANRPTPHRTPTAESGGIAAAVSGARRDSNTPNPDHLGCSICTEDFEAGQDQRVLPCDHRFHPDCVDPWLLNVSGTCPLCRIDLHPAEGEGEPELDEHGNPFPRREVDRNGEPLPLGSDGQGQGQGERQRMSVRRSLLIGLVGARGVERMSQEERLAALRQYRDRRNRAREAYLSANARANAAAGEEGSEQRSEQGDEGRIRNRLRRVLGVRTRRTGTTDQPRTEEAGSEQRQDGQQ